MIAEAKPYLVVRPQKGWRMINFSELWEYRGLFLFLVARDIQVRYKQTVLGGLWAIIQPLAMMLIFTLFFGILLKVPSNNVPYTIFIYSGIVAWTYFSNVVNFSSNSVMTNMDLINKVYYPRILTPLAPIVSNLLDFAISFVILIGLMIKYSIFPNWMIVFLPVVILLMMLTASGVGMLLSAMVVKYRDIRFLLVFVMQFWMFASPVIYPASLIPAKYQWIYAINPMVGVIEGFKASLFGNTTEYPFGMLAVSAIVSVLVFIIGLFYFKQVERYFADVI